MALLLVAFPAGTNLKKLHRRLLAPADAMAGVDSVASQNQEAAAGPWELGAARDGGGSVSGGNGAGAEATRGDC